MKKNIIGIVGALVVISLGSGYWYFNKGKSITTERKSYLLELNNHLISMGINVLDSCDNIENLKIPNVSIEDIKEICFLNSHESDLFSYIAKKPLDLGSKYKELEKNNIDLKTLCNDDSSTKDKALKIITSDDISLICTDQSYFTQLTTQFNNRKTYDFYIGCAKEYSLNLQQYHQEALKNRMGNLPENDLVNMFSDKPRTISMMKDCSDIAENLYWTEVSNSTDQKDLEFCINVLEECTKEFSQESCPKNYKSILLECKKNLKK